MIPEDLEELCRKSRPEWQPGRLVKHGANLHPALASKLRSIVKARPIARADIPDWLLVAAVKSGCDAEFFWQIKESDTPASLVRDYGYVIICGHMFQTD